MWFKAAMWMCEGSAARRPVRLNGQVVTGAKGTEEARHAFWFENAASSLTLPALSGLSPLSGLFLKYVLSDSLC